MEQRIQPSVKAQIQLAASLLGVDASTFMINAALDRARATIAYHEVTVLSTEDRAQVLATLDAPPEPTPALREALAIHRARVVKNT